MAHVLVAAIVPEMAMPPTGIILVACRAISLRPNPAPILMPAAAKYSYAVSLEAVLPDRAPIKLIRSEEHTSELQSRGPLVCRLLLEITTGNAMAWASAGV